MRHDAHVLHDVGMDDDDRWAAVLDRARPVGGWVYGVVTTGVYCRPSCPARRPLRRNVAFFDSPADAARAGLRACRRCRPDQPDGDTASRLVAAVCRAIEQRTEVPTLATLAAEVGVSPSHLQRVFAAATGVSPRAYAERLRADRVARRLAGGAGVSDAAYDAGFGSTSRLSAAAAGRLGMTPSQFRAGGSGEEIRFAVGSSSLGAVLVAATSRGVCAVELGDEPDELVEAFQRRFHAARLVADDRQFAELVATVVTAVERPGRSVDLPLDVAGTAFQERVWQALRRIPPGATVSYADLARQVGAPDSARAVAGACAANRVAVLVPCHRVVRADGALSGYRWGVERKRVLLDREAGVSVPPSAP